MKKTQDIIIEALPMIGITQNQTKLLEFIKTFMEANNGIAPSFSEMQKGVNQKSKSAIHRSLVGLENRGYIRRMSRKTRALELLPQPDPEISTILFEENTRLKRENNRLRMKIRKLTRKTK